MAFASLRIVVIEDIQVPVPRGTDQIVFLLVGSLPVDQTCDVLVLLILFLPLFPKQFLRCPVVVRLSEPLLFNTVLDIEAVSSAALVSNVELAEPLVQTHASQVGLADVSEHILQTAIRSIPNLDALRMRSNEGVEDGVVKHTETSVLISQVMVDRLIIVVEDK